MSVAERREKIMRILHSRRYETIQNLANECNVSTRTMLRDISKMLRSEPIYTQPGRYGGGVYIVKGSNYTFLYLKDEEIQLLKRILEMINSSGTSDPDVMLLEELIKKYTRPKKT